MIALLLSLVATVLASDPVTVIYVMESYCPGCETTTSTSVNPMLEQVGTITNFTAWPYGNAKESQHNSTYWYFSCQHGTNECIGNMYEACAIEHYPSVTNGIPDWWPFFLCLEKSGNAGNTNTAKNCASNHNIDWNVITTCSTTTQPQYGSQADGNPLMHQIAQWTAHMQPPHQYTPWITVDGKLWSSGSLTQAVCNAYTGSNPPAACQKFAKHPEGMAYREELPQGKKDWREDLDKVVAKEFF